MGVFPRSYSLGLFQQGPSRTFNGLLDIGDPDQLQVAGVFRDGGHYLEPGAGGPCQATGGDQGVFRGRRAVIPNEDLAVFIHG